MNQIYRVELEGVDITDHCRNASVSLTVNRFYNVANVEIESNDLVSTILGKTIEVFYGDASIIGFVYSTNRLSFSTHNVVVRTEGAKLSEPFSPKEEKVEDATTAIELCTLYGGIVGIPINYTTEDLDFGGSYERDGTRITALTSIAKTIGAEYYDAGGSITIEADKAIRETYDHELGTDEYFDFIADSNTLYNAGVGIVRTSTGSISGEDITDQNRINLEAYSDGICHIYCIPNGKIESAYGIEIEDVIKTKVISEKVTIINETEILLKASIKDVLSVKLNGINQTNHRTVDGFSVLWFETPQSGYLEIEYVGYYQIGIPSYTPTPNGDLAIVEMYYLNQVLETYWYVDDAVNSGVRVFIDSDPFIYEGFNTYMLDGGVPKIKLYANGVSFQEITQFTAGTYTSKSSISLAPTETTDYEYVISATQTVLLITSFGNTITAVETIDGDWKTLTFDRYYPKVELTVSEVANISKVTGTFIDGEILLTAEDLNTNIIQEFDIGNIDANDLDTLPCMLNQNVPIDVVQLTGQDLQKVSGKSVWVTKPDATIGELVVGLDGILKIWVDMNGVYNINVSLITGTTDSYISLTVNVP